MTDNPLTSFGSRIPLPDATAISARRRLPRRRLGVAVAAGVCAVAAGLALVPAGGADLGGRALRSLHGLWGTPANQPALDRAAEDAASIASGYYTDARVDDSANKVDLYLTRAPRSVIDRLEAKHPGTYVIDDDGAHTLSELLNVEHSLSFTTLQSRGIDVVTAYPTSAGYLKVGVRGHGDVQAAQSTLDSMYGPGIIKVFGGAEPGNVTPYVGTVHRGPAKATRPSGAGNG